MCKNNTCATVMLAFATIFLLAGVIIVGLGFATDNWLIFTVDRNSVINSFLATEPSLDRDQLSVILTRYSNAEEGSELTPTALQNELGQNENLYGWAVNEEYVNRTRGLWHVCFPDLIPYLPYGEINRTLLDTLCRKIQFTNEEGYNTDESTRIHLLRLTLGLFAAGFFLFLVAFLTGMVGCFKRSSGFTSSTGTLVMFAALFCAAGIAVFHGYIYMEEQEHVNDDEENGNQILRPRFGYKKTWNLELREATSVRYGWSYILAWVGVGLCLIASVFFYVAFCAMKGAKKKSEKISMTPTYATPVYPPYEKSLPRQPAYSQPPVYYDKTGMPVYDNRGAYVYSNRAYSAPQYDAYYYGQRRN